MNRAAKLPLTGAEIVRRAGLQCAIGKHNEYQWRQRVVVLTSEVFGGTDERSHAIVAHEIAHSLQPRWWWWFRWFTPWANLMEVDAMERCFGNFDVRASKP